MTVQLANRLMMKHLRLIVAVAEHTQLTIAAQALGMTQPAASRMLAEAVAQVGAPLFERNARGMVLTDVGEALARRARNVLDEIADAAEEVERLRTGRGGLVRIGAVTGAAEPVVARLIADELAWRLTGVAGGSSAVDDDAAQAPLRTYESH